VKPAEFAYVRAGSVAEASALLLRHGDGARLLAGGQSLLPALNLRLSAPSLLIDIGGLPELRGVLVRNGALHLGAGTHHAELLTTPEIRQHAPLLAMAARHIAHPAIRTRGTLGGSLAQADPAAELPACMLALGARIVAASGRGERVIPAEAFTTGLFATALAPDEVITRVEIPLPTPGARAAFHELARRSGDYAMVGLAAQAGEGLSGLRLAFFAVGTTPVLARRAAAALVAGEGVERAQEALAQDLSPHDDLQASAATRLALARVLLKRTVVDLRKGAA
jgi:carbon-monoxide dehydrogenase medium subunit